MDWQEEPATNQQLLILQEYGFVPACPLTVTQAARLIRQFSKRPQRGTAPPAPAAPPPQPAMPHPVAELRGPSFQVQSEDMSESARMHAYRLRLAIDAAEKVLEANPEGPNVRADYFASIAARRDFWHDTCREVREMLIGSIHVLEFHRNYGAGFFAPTGDEVQEVLEALDRALPMWDKDHPELFYQTLGLNFPSHVRQRKIDR